MIVLNSPNEDIKIVKWKVRKGTQLSINNVICLYETVGENNSAALQRFKATCSGIVQKLMFKDGEVVKKE